MRVALIALDTRGGVQPYLALGRGLHAAGHDVRLLTTGDAVPADPGGLSVVAITPGTADRARGLGAAELRGLARLRLMREHAATTTAATARAALDACRGVDLVTAGIGGMTVAPAVAEELGVPFVATHLQPIGPATAAFPGPVLRSPPAVFGQVGNIASHLLSGQALRVMFAGTVRRGRAALGLPTRPAPTPPDLPVLYGYSPVVVPHPPEWGPHRHVTGYWTFGLAAGWTPPARLTAFLAAGPPPVCIGFGSMTGRDPAALTRTVRDAVRRAGTRAVLLTGWGALEGPRDGTDDADVLVADDVPHEWLLPRCAAVVHHGGAGTTAAALRAGIPAVVVPFAADQHFWASRVTALGAGPAPVPRRRLTVERLTAALVRVGTDAPLRAAASRVGARLRAEDGVAAAVERLAGVAV